jgi:hypothetical protein
VRGGVRAALGVGALLLAPLAGWAEDYRVEWSAALEAALHGIASQEADDGVTGFFDQYRFTPNKGTTPPIEIGLSEASLDLLGVGDEPLLRFRLASPTSNLGITGSDHAFLNQRALLLGARRGLFLDLRYRRLRTEDLRRFPDPSGSGSVITDLTSPDDRFYRERTGFDTTLRLRPADRFGGLPDWVSDLGGEVELRGGYEGRNGERQRRFLLPPLWLSNDQEIDQGVGTVGGGLLLAPAGLFTLALDVDHQRFREDARTLTDADFGVPGTRAVGFVPDTDRTTGTVRIQRRFGERAALRGGFRMSLLEQVDDRTFGQRGAGLDDNELLFTSADVAGDLQIVGGLSANAHFGYDERDNRIDRNTPLFNASGGGQVGGFLDDLSRMTAGGELVYVLRSWNRVAAGVRAEWVDRDLEYVNNPAAQRILPVNASIADESESLTVYGRTRLRPLRGLDVRAELGYRDAPETGYAVELDDYLYGRADVSYALPIERPAVISGFARGGSGENRDFSYASGLGPSPAGPVVDREFERTDIFWGVTAMTAAWERTTVFASFFQARNAQDYDLLLSDQSRYFQDAIPVSFANDGPIDYRSDDLGTILGLHFRADERTDAGLSYTWNRIKTRFRTSGSASGGVELIEDASRIDADIHRVALRLGHRLRDGLKLTAGYRFDYYDDRSPVRGAGVVPPFDLRTFQHTVTFGVVLSSELLE